MAEQEIAAGELAALWCEAFGEPPPILIEPAQMRAILLAYAPEGGAYVTSLCDRPPPGPLLKPGPPVHADLGTADDGGTVPRDAEPR
jgi:hypothetical protein